MPKNLTIDLPLDLAEPLQIALYTQLAYARRQATACVRLLADPHLTPTTVELLELEIKQYTRQVEALDTVMRQVGRHV